MKKYLIFITLLWLATCTPMDDKYKDFVNDGPKVYLSKLDDRFVELIGERERINFRWPAINDPRCKTAIIYWSSRSGKFEWDFDPAAQASFFVAPLTEGSYIFEIHLTDNEGHTSIPISVTGYSYGSLYESFLINRRIIGSALTVNNRTVTCPQVVDSTLIGTNYEWRDADQTLRTGFIAASQLTGTLDGCQALSLRYRTQYSPEGGVDIFYSPWDYYVENVKAEDFVYDYLTNKFTFLKPDDGNWEKIEMSWTDKTTGEAHSYTMENDEAVIPEYNAREFNYYSVFTMDEQQFVSAVGTVKTAVYTDLDRTGWYAAPETDLNGDPIANVNYGSSAPPTPTQGPSGVSTITNKIKSPYLSHWLPFANAALSTTNGDGVNNPSAHFDNNSSTYLSMVKGIGTDATFTGAADPPASSWFHVNGGVIITQANEKPWFIIRLDEHNPQRFNYFRMRYREGGSLGSGLKPQGVTLFGSNDDACITDESKWTRINPQIIVPSGSTVASSQPSTLGILAPAANLESDNMLLPAIVEYRYVKVQYDRWELASNTMQLAEFWLGLYD